ncbi:MAG: tRNA (5-methylaminomethyl-2-thiouridine)(34)-methyltransferase MnmD [Paracoccaceae bacterium]
MTTQPQPTAVLTWQGAIPVSRQFDDPYFSLAGGLDETRHVFLSGNRLAQRLTDGFHIAELGFGTGLNMLATALLWHSMGAPGTVHFTSFEAFPMAPADMARALGAYPETAGFADALVQQWAGGARQIALPGLSLTIIAADARQALPVWAGQADAWFLDGFSPAKNPELWTPELMQEVARHTAPGGSFATYTAAGHVRRALAEAGFAVTRTPGYANKRHMSVGQLPPAPQPPSP